MPPRSRVVSVIRSRAPAGAVSIGGIIAPLRRRVDHDTSRSALSPHGYLARLPETLRPSLKWLAQKDALGQDVLLLTSPAERARARLLALAYAELVHAELEYLAVSADTTEADLKQRRELLPGGNVSFSESPPVRAALGGGVLVLDGLERAERNVLPTINNLLENREMSLDDGRFLIERRRYDSVMADSSREAAPAVAKLQPVHDLFRVIALASPCPPFAGRALDPPLRSRFQALLVPPVSSEELVEQLSALPDELARSLLAANETIAELERQSVRHDGLSGFFSFSSTALQSYCSTAPAEGTQPLDILKRIYPPLCQRSDNNDAVHQALRRLGITSTWKEDADTVNGELVDGHFRTPRLAANLTAIVADLEAGRNVLLLGPRGCGKSALVRALQDQTWRTFALHRDLTARDLLQRRVTDQASGASGWADQPCVAVARAGGVAVLDGVHRLPRGAFVAAFGRLCTERELDLPDGTRLIDAARLSELEASSRVEPLPPDFRILALGEPGDWLTPEIASLFATHVLPELTPLELKHALKELVPSASVELCQRVSDVAAVAMAAQSNDAISVSERAVLGLSMRVLLRLTRRAADEGIHQVGDLLHCTLMSKFLPPRLQEVIDSWLKMSGLAKDGKDSMTQVIPKVTVDESVLKVGDRSLPRRVPSRPELVPSPRDFFESSAALRAVTSILDCERVGETSILLLGNQGVGKNVAIDRVLQLLAAEREYVQLHRDTTVSSLTVMPVLEDGLLRYEDAPLVRAAKYGRVCVLDEADKAPTEVVVILKALVEDGELVLGDGRRLLSGAALHTARRSAEEHGLELQSDIIPVHEDFRLWVLANRPGFPFHGNAFFRECGDVFAAIALDNPDVQSERALLEHVAPTYPKRAELLKLARAFAHLRALAEVGTLAYPYSMREAVAVARHLQKYPKDSITEALTNVLAFEAFDVPLRRKLAEVFEEHGFEGVTRGLEDAFGLVSGESDNGRSAFRNGAGIDIRYIPEGGESIPRTGMDGPKHGEIDPTGAPHVGGNRWAGGSGGSDTAGLGGRGGPYRLWDGNPVHQVSEEAKAEVTEEAKARARALAHQAWHDRLAEIDKMDDRMWSMYNGVYSNVEPQIAQLGAIFQQARDKQRERVWLRNRSDGELDDARLVEGIAGDRLVFKRRGKSENPVGMDTDHEESRKRRICFVMDCSGSMYRFNGLDGRLNRMLEATCLILETLQGHLDRYEYALLGHSGESSRVDFVAFGKPPANRGEHLKILQQMVAHTQFCMPGDNTIEATRAAIDYVRSTMASDTSTNEEESDNGVGKGRAFVVVLSDANFRRYRMDPLWWSDALMHDPVVEGHAVMIGSLGEEAKRIRASLPPGRGHIVLDTALLPATFKTIFAQAGLISDGF